ncbi:MAG: hypothetical protein ACRCYY_20290 [Trueperaceae bacterium]
MFDLTLFDLETLIKTVSYVGLFGIIFASLIPLGLEYLRHRNQHGVSLNVKAKI